MATVVAVILGTLVLMLGAGVWVGISLYAVGIVGLAVFRNVPIDKLIGQVTYNIITTPELIALPMFILMAEILFRTRLSAMLFRGLAPWVTNLPGRLLHINVRACTLFAAISGSSAATTATVGRITLSELFARGYDRRITMGSLAGAGTLGFLIPPSSILIIYGVLAEESILKLFIAGVIPGLMLALGYMLLLGTRATLNPRLVAHKGENPTWADRLRGILDIGPSLMLIVLVLGSMYAGYATPSEAAAVGALGALVVSMVQGTLTLGNIRAAAFSTVRTTSMIGLIVCGAVFLSVVMGYLGIPREIANAIAALHLGPIALIMLLLVFYALLGTVLDGISSIVMTLPITLPLALAAGFDKVWFGVFIVIVVEMAQITPPVGFNLFVIQGLTGEPVMRIAVAAFPFFIIMFLLAILITLFPEVVTWLPDAVTLRG
jgi:tripartite ATP-independent transporter DctM subunit